MPAPVRPHRDARIGALLLLTLLLGCNDTRDLAPASPSAPWPPGAQDYAVPPALADSAPAAAADDAPPLGHAYSLAELIDLAERRNRGTRVAWEQARQAAIRVGVARAAYLPEITASALGGYQHIASPFPTDLVSRGYITANGQEVFPELAIRYLLLDFGGGREAATRTAEQLSLAANIGFNAAHQQLIMAVARGYFTLDGAEAQLRAAQQALADARTLQGSAEALQGRGLATSVAALAAQRNTAQAAYALAHAQAGEQDARNALLATLELPPHTPLAVQDSSRRPLPRSLPGTVEQLMQGTLARRADLAADLARLRAADAAVDRARAASSPTLSLQTNVQGNLGRIAVDGGRYESVEQPQAGLFLRFDWPLYQGGARANGVRLAQSERAAAQDALEAARTEAMRQVASAADALQASLAQYDAAETLRRAAQTAFAAARDAYSHGVGSLPDAASAQAALASAEADLARAHSQCLIDAAGLAFATGDLTSAASPAIGQPP